MYKTYWILVMNEWNISSNKIYLDENIVTYFAGFVKGVCTDESEMLLIDVIKSVAFN